MVRRIAVVALFPALACAHVKRAPPGYNVSSERSDYTPSLRLAVAVPVVDTAGGRASLIVAIDSGIITAVGGGGESSDTVAVMGELHLTALLVTAPSTSRGDGPPSPWRAVAQSDSVRIADALRLGEPHAIPRIQLSMETHVPIDPRQTWLVFRVTGGAMTKEITMPDGKLIPARRVPGGVRVFACADWSLAGYVDRKRAKALARAYNAAC